MRGLIGWLSAFLAGSAGWWLGINGVPHWARVRWNALAMARVNGAREDVVELFAFLHDSPRFSDGRTGSMVRERLISLCS